jgi:hypothetical protein
MVRNLLPERNFHPKDSDISFYCYTPAKDGTIVCVYSWPNGALLDDPNAEVGPPQGTLADTIPAGVILQEFIEFDNTRFSRDMSDFEVMMVGNKAAVYKNGWCVTRCIAASADPVLSGKPAYYDINGYFTTVAGSVCVGTFQSERNADGYARVYVDIPTYGRQAGL